MIPPVPINNLEIHEYATLANNTLYARYRITFGPPVSGDNVDVGEFVLDWDDVYSGVTGAVVRGLAAVPRR